MQTSAKHRHAKISPQKCRLVADQVRGLPVDKALTLLTFSNKKAAVLVRKGPILASCFHPELQERHPLTEHFANLVRGTIPIPTSTLT